MSTSEECTEKKISSITPVFIATIASEKYKDQILQAKAKNIKSLIITAITPTTPRLKSRRLQKQKAIIVF